MKFPDSTYFNRKLPKQRFYENLTISAATKKSFVDQIKSIYWENKISADTINIAAENKVTEIEIFRINLNQDTIDESVLRLLDKGIPYAEMVNIVNDKPVEFAKYKFDADTIRSMFDNFSFSNGRPITKAMIAWWAYQNDKQPLLSLETTFEIEHIYARNRNEKENSLSDARNVECLINIMW